MTNLYTPPEKPRKLKRKGSGFLALSIYAGLLVLVCMFVVSKHGSTYSTGYRISEIRDEIQELREERAKLRSQLAGASSPDRVYREALALGLRPLPSDHRVEVFVMNTPVEQSDEDNTMLATYEGVR